MLPVAGNFRGLRSTIVGNLSLLWIPPFLQATSLFSAPSFLLRVLLHGATVGAFMYLASIGVAAAIGFALPTTALMRWSPAVSWLATYDYYVIYSLLLIVMLCVVSSWLATWSGVAAASAEDIYLTRQLNRWGLLLACCFFVFSLSAPWSGLPREGDFGAASIAGLIPFSDAGGYFASAHDYFKDGFFSSFALRRPFAAAGRTLLLALGNFSYASMLLLQAVLLATATWFGARAISRWRGPWAGLVYFCISFLILRSFIATSLTEPIGLFWALFAIPFVIEGLRKGSWPLALLGLTFTSVALMTRMGAMFLMPMLALWMLWRFGTNWLAKLGLAAGTVAVFAAVIGVNFAIERLYGHDRPATGENFSYTICGLSIGGDWSECPKRYSTELKELPPGERALTTFLYHKAFDNIRDNASPFLGRLGLGAGAFISSLPSTMLRGYLHVPLPWWFSTLIFYLICAFGLIYVVVMRGEKGELGFWILISLGVVASAAVVYFDDGRRVLAVAYPFLATLVASGFKTPRTVIIRDPKPSHRLVSLGLATLLGGAVVLCAGPRAVVGALQHTNLSDTQHPKLPNVHYLRGGRRVTGFLVVANDDVLRTEVPSMHLSDFMEIVRRSNIEIYQGLVHPEVPHLPFGFIVSARVEKTATSNFSYIVPPEVLLRNTPSIWQFTVKPWQRRPEGSVYWYMVTDAKPIQTE
jgi:hypothetical protein